MTVKEKIFKLNKQFQISYYDERSDFFSYKAPDMITELKNFLTTTSIEHHSLINSVTKHIELLDIQLEDLEALAKNVSAKEWVKDKWLNGFKINVSNICWGFDQECRNFDENILNQVI